MKNFTPKTKTKPQKPISAAKRLGYGKHIKEFVFLYIYSMERLNYFWYFSSNVPVVSSGDEDDFEICTFVTTFV